MNALSRVILFFLLSFVAVTAHGRVWKAKGGHTVEAEFLDVEKGMVSLRLENGREIQVPFASFLDEDQTEIRRLYQEKQERIKEEKAKRIAEIRAKWKPGEVIERKVNGETRAVYHVYVPTSFDPDNPPPVLYAFSPNGNGKGQMYKMKASAEKVGWMVIGCNGLKNKMDMSLARKIEDTIFADVKENVPHNPEEVYMSGFSGGAWRCYHISSRRKDLNVKGILAFGGWLGGEESQKKFKFPKGMIVAIINGEDDKSANSWVESDSKAIKRSKCTVKAFSFPGGHTMPGDDLIHEAMKWIIEERGN